MKAVTYAEMDLPYCALTYGRSPCRALMVGEVTRHLTYYFNGTVDGWTPSDATLTPALGGVEFESTGAFPRMIIGSLSIAGATQNRVRLDITRVSNIGGTWVGRLSWTTGGHGYSASYYIEYPDIAVGERAIIELDMSAPTAGGTDWVTNTITGISLALENGGTSEFIVHEVRIGHEAVGAEATGTAKCFNTLATCQDLERYDVNENPITPLGAKIEAFTSSPGTASFNITGRSWGAVASGEEVRSIAILLQVYHPAGAPSLTSAIMGDATALIRGSSIHGTVGTYLIEATPSGTDGTLALVFGGTVQEIAGTSYRLINAEFVSVVGDTTLPDPQRTVDVERNDLILGSVASFYMSTTVWTGIIEDTSSVLATDFRPSTGLLSRLESPVLDDLVVKAENDYKSVAAPVVVTSVLGSNTSLPFAINVTALAGDIIIYAVETANEGVVAPAQCNALTGNINASSPQTRLNVYWERAATDLVSASRSFNLSGSDDHIVILAVVIRGVVPTTGDPHLEVVTGFTNGSVTTATIPGLTAPTTIKNSLVLDIIARGSDVGGAQFSGWANADLTGLTEINDGGTTGGDGGGLAMNYGVRATQGSVGNTTVNIATGTSVAFCKVLFAPTSYADVRNSLIVARYRWLPQIQNNMETLRFGMDTGFNNPDIQAINCIEDYSHTPTVVSLGEDLGTREKITFQMMDVQHPDVGPGFDKYWRERPYNSYERGTLWPRLLARYPFFGGCNLRWYEGDASQSLEEMETRHFLIDNISGPNSRGGVTVVGKDPLKLLDSDKSLAPRPSLGYLLSDITDVATSAELTPLGVGDVDYPTSGRGVLAGNELVTYTRSGDNLTIVRAQDGTPSSEHTQQDHFQTALVYDAMDPADILYDLFTRFGGVDPGWINLEDWQAETDSYLRRNYTAIIGEPIAVRKLVIELIVSCGLAIWWDSEAQRVRLNVLREIPSDAVLIDASVRVEDVPTPKYQPEKRVSQTLVHFAIKDPLKGVTDPNNFRQRAWSFDTFSEGAYRSSAIKTIFSRWIAPFARTTALRVGDLNTGRFAIAPRRLTFRLPREGTIKPVTGAGYRIQAKNLQAADGSQAILPIQMVSVKVSRDGYDCEAEEMSFRSYTEEDLAARVITISGTSYNINLRDIHDDIYPSLRPGDTVTFIFDETSKVGSNNHTLPAVDVGVWPATFVPHLDVRGKIQGKGGPGGIGRSANGGDPSSGQRNGAKGGTALKVRAGSPITITYTLGKIWAGGGGGAGGSCADLDNHRGGGGGGGAGLLGGDGGLGPGNGEDGKPGTETAGGAYGRSYTSSTFWTSPSLRSNIHGGAGGGPGLAGDNDVGGYDLSGGSPGAAGNWIEGFSSTTVIGAAGDHRGIQVA